MVKTWHMMRAKKCTLRAYKMDLFLLFIKGFTVNWTRSWAPHLRSFNIFFVCRHSRCSVDATQKTKTESMAMAWMLRDWLSHTRAFKKNRIGRISIIRNEVLSHWSRSVIFRAFKFHFWLSFGYRNAKCASFACTCWFIIECEHYESNEIVFLLFDFMTFPNSG